MKADWTFLEPWFAVLRACTIQGDPSNSRSEMQITVLWPHKRYPPYPQYNFVLMVHLNEWDPKAVTTLIQIREAIEIFTILSIMNHDVFMELFPNSTQHPTWKLFVCGDVTVQRVAWKRVFELLDPSPHFQQAIQTLMAMGPAQLDYSRHLNYVGTEMRWRCEFEGVDVQVDITNNRGCIFDGVETDLQTVFNAGVSLIIQLGLTSDRATLGTIQDNRRQIPLQASITITTHDFTVAFPRVLAGLIWAKLHPRGLSIDEENDAGLQEARIYTGVLSYRANQWFQVNDTEMRIWSTKVSKCVSAAIYLTISMISEPTSEIIFAVGSVDSESWPWLVHSVCCDPSVESTLLIDNATLTKADVSSIEDVLKSSYHDSIRRTIALSGLNLHFTSIESVSSVMSLLGLIGRNLRSLTLCTLAHSNEFIVDLSILAVVCPTLRTIEVDFEVVVSAHNEPLHRWPIQSMNIIRKCKLKDLILCLRNPRLRMARELRLLTLPVKEELDENEVKEISSHSGDFLAVTKEKFPIESKIAMISVVNSGHHARAIRWLNEDVLALTFVFASTPAQRLVNFHRVF